MKIYKIIIQLMVGLSFGVIILIILKLLNFYILKFNIPEFLLGGFCMIACYAGMDFFRLFISNYKPKTLCV